MLPLVLLPNRITDRNMTDPKTEETSQVKLMRAFRLGEISERELLLAIANLRALEVSDIESEVKSILEELSRNGVRTRRGKFRI